MKTMSPTAQVAVVRIHAKSIFSKGIGGYNLLSFIIKVINIQTNKQF